MLYVACYHDFMLNPFPELLSFSLLGPFVLRVVLGLIFLDLGILKFRGEKIRWLASFEALNIHPADLMLAVYALLQIVGGLFLIAGFWTQIAALVLAIFSGVELSIEWKAREILKRDFIFYLLLFAISLSLLITGAGAFAFDIPL
ncbi:MAG: DoxX family protein [Patescibacteria group bacterium]